MGAFDILKLAVAHIDALRGRHIQGGGGGGEKAGVGLVAARALGGYNGGKPGRDAGDYRVKIGVVGVGQHSDAPVAGDELQGGGGVGPEGAITQVVNGLLGGGARVAGQVQAAEGHGESVGPAVQVGNEGNRRIQAAGAKSRRAFVPGLTQRLRGGVQMLGGDDFGQGAAPVVPPVLGYGVEHIENYGSDGGHRAKLRWPADSG